MVRWAVSRAVWGMLVHPTCARGSGTVGGECFDSFPVATTDLSGVFQQRITNAAGRQRRQLIDVDAFPEENRVVITGKVVQNDTGLESNLFRPGADFKLTLKLVDGKMMVRYEADGFPAAEAFWVAPSGVEYNLFNSESYVKTAPSPLAMAAGELSVLIAIASGCLPGSVFSSQGCVAIKYQVDVPVEVAGG